MANVWCEYNEPGKSITPYLFYGYGLTNLQSLRIVNRMAKFLEYKGYKTLCFLPTWLSSSYKLCCWNPEVPLPNLLCQ